MDQVTDQDRRELDAHSMGMEDYALARPNRRDHAPDPTSYQQGWDEAARREAYEGMQDEINSDHWAGITAYDMDPDVD